MRGEQKMGRKYEMVEDTLVHDGVTLHRIRALKDFSDVKAGDLGGWIERESNLSQTGSCWVYDDAMVYGTASVKDNARVESNVEIRGNAHVCGNTRVCCAEVYGSAIICDSASLVGNAEVYGSAIIGGKALISGYAVIHGCAKVLGESIISGCTIIKDQAFVCDTSIGGDASIGSDAIICSGYDYLSATSIIKGQRLATTIYRSLEDGIYVTSGSQFCGTLCEFDSRKVLIKDPLELEYHEKLVDLIRGYFALRE